MDKDFVINDFLRYKRGEIILRLKFWENINNALIIGKYLFDEKLITSDILKSRSVPKTLKELAHPTLYKTLSNDIDASLIYISGGEVRIWEMYKVPLMYCENEDIVREYMLWFMETNSLTVEDVHTKITLRKLNKKIVGALPLYKIFKITLGNEYIQYLKYFKREYMKTHEYLVDYIKYKIEIVHKLDPDNLEYNVSTKMFHRTLVSRYSNFELIEMAYPGKYNKYNVKRLDTDDIESVKHYLLWIVNKKFKLDIYSLNDTLTYSMIPQSIHHKYSMSECIELLCGRKYHTLEIRNCYITNLTRDVCIEYINSFIINNSMTLDLLYRYPDLLLSTRTFKKHHIDIIKETIVELVNQESLEK